MTIFQLAIMQLKREGKINDRNVGQLVIDRALTIRKWLDLSDQNTENINKRYEKVC